MSDQLAFPSMILTFFVFVFMRFVIFTGLGYCPRPSWISERTDEQRSQSSHCVGMAASGLTFDQLEPCMLVSVTGESRL